MPELTPQELNVAVTKALNLHIEGGNERRNERSWYLMREDRKVVATLSRYSTAVIKDEETAFEFLCPKFATSLDACKPLIEEMRESGREVSISFRADHVRVGVSQMCMPDHFVISVKYAEFKGDKCLAAATALCRAYLKFKELTKEETK